MDNAGNISETNTSASSTYTFEDAATSIGNKWNRFYTNVIDDDENEIYQSDTFHSK